MKNYPAIKITILFIFGILLQKVFVLPHLIVIVILLSSVLIIITLIRFFTFEKIRLIVSVLIFLCVIILGNYLISLELGQQVLLPSNLYRVKKFKVYGKIEKIELNHNNKIKFLLNADSIIIKNKVLPYKIKLLCELHFDNQKQIDSVYENIFPGNSVYLSGTYRRGREKRNPGEFDYNNYLHSKGISGVLRIYRLEDFKISGRNKSFLSGKIFSIRKYVYKNINLLQEPKTAGLLKGLLLADRSEISVETKSEFINSGVVHVLAVSGLHVGYIILIFLLIFGRFNIYIRSIITAVGLLMFMFITGVPASVFRATLMAMIIIFALLTNRSTNLYNSLALAALIILLIKPAELFNPGFQLSFTAVLSIAAIYQVLAKKIQSSGISNKFVIYTLLIIAVSLSAQIGTLPFTLIYFGKLSIIALFANILVVPLIGFIVGTAIFTLVINPFFPLIASYYASANNLFGNLLFEIVKISGNFKYAFLWIRHFTVIDAIIYYLLIVIFFYFYQRFNSKKAKILLFALTISNLMLFMSFDDAQLLPDKSLNVLMIDVGQGDAFLIKFPNGKTALIDAGNATASFDNGERVILPLLDYLSINKIDYGFVSHIDADHYGGFISLIHNGRIRQIFKPKIDSSLKKDIKFEKYLTKNNVPFSYYKKEILKIGNVRLYIMNDIDKKYFNKLSTNNNSGFLKIVYGNDSYLFLGDMGKKAERYYRNYYKGFLNVDVLKVSHHGSNSSSEYEFLKAVTPKYSLISVGLQNKFHHPSTFVINELKSINSKIFRTDLDRAVLLRDDGSVIKNIDWRNY
mgnify:CR=1 FL=1